MNYSREKIKQRNTQKKSRFFLFCVQCRLIEVLLFEEYNTVIYAVQFSLFNFIYYEYMVFKNIKRVKEGELDYVDKKMEMYMN